MSPEPSCLEMERLLAYRFGSLDAAAQEAVFRHLSGCAVCEGRLASIDAGMRLTSPGSPEPPTTPQQMTRSLPAPPSFGQYRLLEELGRGGMGAVHAALHVRLKKRVAIKLILPEFAHDGALVARFLRETEAVGSLSHPNVVTATDAGEVDGRPFLVMELVEGLNLSALQRFTGPLAVADACEIARQTAVGLHYIHEQKRVHRDLKPSNLMLSVDGVVKILDLGLANVFSEGRPAEELTPRNQFMGTADYMAPEQWTDSHSVDVRADLYSLGCTLFKLLTGTPPFGGAGRRTPAEKMKAHLEDPPPPLSRWRGDLPEGLSEVVARLLAKQADDRFAAPGDAARALEPFCVGAALPALLTRARQSPTPTPVPGSVFGRAVPTQRPPAEPRATDTPLSEPRDPPPPAPRRGSNKALAAGVLVGLALLAGALVYFQQPEEEVPEPVTEAPKAPSVNWPDDYPEELRERPWGKSVRLLWPNEHWNRGRDPARVRASIESPTGPDLRHQPAWCRRLTGTGRYCPYPERMVLGSSYPGVNQGCTFLALDDDPAGRWFAFEAELHSVLAAQDATRVGVFFGWRRQDPRGVYLVQPNERALVPAPGKGELSVSYLALPPPQPGKEPIAALLDPGRAAPVGSVPLRAQRNRYRVKVRAVPGQVTVAVDDDPPLRFAPAHDPRGALGIWVQNGRASFGRVVMTALPEGTLE